METALTGVEGIQTESNQSTPASEQHNQLQQGVATLQRPIKDLKKWTGKQKQPCIKSFHSSSV